MNERSHKRAICLAIAVTTVFTGWIFNHLLITTSPSLNHRVFWKLDGDIAKGDYVNFILYNSLINGGHASITKRVACWPGDMLLRVDRSFYCNGLFLGTAKSKSFEGKPLPLFQFQGRIPQGMAFVAGDDRNSFDSRYWGFLDLHEPIQRLTPVRLLGI